MQNLPAMETSPEKGKLETGSRCDTGQVRGGKIYKGQNHIKYDACNTYI